MTRAAVLLLCAGCVPDVGADDPYVVLRGVVDPAVMVAGDDGVVVVLWVSSHEGELCLETQELEVAVEVTGFAIDVQGPPPLVALHPCVPAPDSVGGGATAWGLVTLLDPDPEAVPAATASPILLLDWFAGEPVALTDFVQVDRGKLAGVLSALALVSHVAGPPFGAAYCRFDLLTEGFSVYEDDGTGCGGWTPIELSARRSEVQGVQIVPP